MMFLNLAEKPSLIHVIHSRSTFKHVICMMRGKFRSRIFLGSISKSSIVFKKVNKYKVRVYDHVLIIIQLLRCVMR